MLSLNLNIKNNRMRKFSLLTLMVVIIPFISFSQEIVGKSKVMQFNITQGYERGLPPNLFVDLNFKDENQNGIIESEESAELHLIITNKGKGSAQGLDVIIEDNVTDENFNIIDSETKTEIRFVQPGESKEVTIKMKAGFDVESAEHKLKINVKEHYGFDMDPAYLVLNTLEYQKPKLVFSGLEIVDVGEGTGAIIEDGLLQAGEQVKTKIVVQNVGQNIAKNTKFEVKVNDENIYFEDVIGEIGDMKIGEVKEFWITLTPNKRVKYTGKLPVYLTLTEEIGRGNLIDYQLPLQLNQKPPETNTLAVKADIEKLQKQVARFEYKSDKFKVNMSNIANIRQVVPAKTKRENAVAVVIGIEEYENLASAPYAANDANIIKDYFRNRLGIANVVTLTNKEVDGFAFDDIFNPEYGQLQKSIIKGETDLFVFYSGHGVPSKDGENVYLFPYDGKIERLQFQGYNINKLYESLEKLGARSVNVFIDACFSGVSKSSQNLKSQNLVSMKGVRIVAKTGQPWINNENFTVFSSSSMDETSLGFDPSQTGLFTYYLCLGMQGEADMNKDKKITMEEIQLFVSKNVMETSKKISGLQTPEFHGNKEQVLIEL
jgi:hypothetical protein